MNIRNDVNRVIQDKGLKSIALLSIHSATDVHYKVTKLFCRHTQGIETKVWLWEYYLDGGSAWSTNGDIAHLKTNCPKSSQCFLLLEGDGVQLPFWVYSGITDDVVVLLEELYSIEYYIADNHFKWLLSENHHDIMCKMKSNGI